MILQSLNVIDPALVIKSFDADILPNAGAGEARTPVPAKAAWFLSHVRAAFGLVRANPFVQRALAFTFIHDWIGRIKTDFDFVAAGGQRRFYDKFPRAKHIVRRANLAAIDFDARK